MKNKKMVFGTIIFLFAMTGICGVSNAFIDDIYLSPASYGSYNLGSLIDGDIIKINEIDSSGIINVYIMNKAQFDNIGGLSWEYLARWKDISYLSDYNFDVAVDDDYYIVLYNKDIFVGRNIHVNIFVEYKGIIITSPSSYDTFLSGYNWIIWTSTGNFDYVIIDLYENGYFLETIRSGINNDGSYEWYIYNDEYIDSSNYQIKIRDYYDDNTYDYSSYFTIESEVKTIIITSPISSSVFESGYNDITWTTTGSIDYITIDLYKNGLFLETIDSYEYNDGSYSWYIYDDDYANSSYYHIRISDYYDDYIDDYSDYFTINVEEPEPTPTPPIPPPNIIGIDLIPLIAIISLATVIPLIIITRKIKSKSK